jgi:hypothetical protein
MLLLALILVGSGCNVGDVGSSSKSDSDNTNTNVINNRPDGTGASNDACDGVMSLDGAGGFLWKPVSESDNKPVVLFPKSFSVKFEQVISEGVNGDFYEGKFAGFQNDSRQHWRFEESAELHVGRIIADDCEWVFPEPTERQD